MVNLEFEQNEILSSKYKVISKLGGGWEGEVYLVKEVDTDIERAAKFFYPQRNLKNKTVKNYAKKLHKLRACNSLIKYIAKDQLLINGHVVTYLLSDFVEGYTLDTYLNSWHPEGMEFYQALHLFYAIVKAVEEIHIHKEWHGDVHAENIIIQKMSLNYDLKLIDVFHRTHSKKGSLQEDVFQLCRVLYELVGGKKGYKFQPRIIKEVCLGLKNSLIRKKFRTATSLRVFLENSNWE